VTQMWTELDTSVTCMILLL